MGQFDDAVEAGFEFLRFLFEPEDWIELRLLPAAKQRWFRLVDAEEAGAALLWAAKANARVAHPQSVYVGANPRSSRGGSKNKDVTIARVVFADLDGGVTPEQAVERIKAAGLPVASVVVASGGGVHAWWRLEAPASNLAAWKETMKGIIASLDADKSCKDEARVMRLPGFRNCKPERLGRPMCSVVVRNEQRHPIAHFPVVRRGGERGRTPTAPQSGGMSDETAAFFELGEVRGDSRRQAIFRIACDLKGNGWDCAVAEQKIMERVRSLPEMPGKAPLSVEDIDDIPRQVRNAFAQPREPGHRSARDGGCSIGPVNLRQARSLTDTGLARRLAAKIRGSIVYVRESNRQPWWAWDGKRWAVNGEHVVQLAAKSMHDELWREFAALRNGSAVVEKFVRDSGHRARISAAIELAQSEPGINVSLEEFDTHPMLLNVRNGVLDLSSGELLPHDPKLRLTQLAAVEYVPDARSDLWEQFIRDVTRGDDELADFLQQAFGIVLTADVSDELLICHRGAGCNGKTTALEAVSRMLGDYAAVAPPGMFAARSFEGHPTELAGLRGKRLVTSSEQEADRTLRESLIKSLTGGDTIRTRGMREDFWEMRPTWHFHLAYNRDPRLTRGDGGIRRRLRTAPWEASFEDAPDPTIKQRLCGEGERPGILAWCLAGLRRRLLAGRLPYPPAVRHATEGYLQQEDAIGQFLDECVVIDRNDRSILVRVDELAESCRQWMVMGGQPKPVVDAVDVRALSRRLGDRGICTIRPDGGEHRKKAVAYGVRVVSAERAE